MTDDAMRKLIRDAVAEAIHDHLNCPLSTDAKKEAGHFFGMLSDIAPDGKHSTGVEVFRTIAARQSRYVRWSRAVETTVLSTFIAYLAYKLIEFIAAHLKVQ